MHGEVRDALGRAARKIARRECWCSPAPAAASAPARISATARLRPGQGGRPRRHRSSKYYKPLVLALRTLPMPVIAPSTASRQAPAPTSRCPAISSSRRARQASFRRSASSASCPIRAAPGSCRGSSALRARWGSRCSATSFRPSRPRSWGLIWRCVDDAELQDDVDALAAAARARADARPRRDQAGDLRVRRPIARAAARPGARFPARARPFARLRRGRRGVHRKRNPQFTGR